MNVQQYFGHDSHLPPELRPVVQSISQVAAVMNEELPESEERQQGLMLLLTAQDWFMRAKINTFPKSLPPEV